MGELAQFAQLGGLGIFAYLLLRHVLVQSSKLANTIDNHMRTHGEVLAEIRDSLKETKSSLENISRRLHA